MKRLYVIWVLLLWFAACAQDGGSDLLQQSIDQYTNGDFNGCINTCELILDKDPTNATAWNNLCAAYNSIGEYDRAKAACLKCLQLTPGDNLAKNNLKEALAGMARKDMMAHLPKVEMVLDSASFAKITAKRNAAVSKGLLISEKTDWVNAGIRIDSSQYNASVRLKGDWTDHLQGDKWSFRIKLAKGQAWHGMTEFSVHHPGTRDYLKEWLLHMMMEDEGILTTRYSFVHVFLNGKDLGIYAMEEHFAKQLVESRKRREGPIMRFDERGFWNAKLHLIDDQLPVFQSAVPMCYKVNHNLKSPVLRRHLMTALSLMEAYKQGKTPVNKIFDTKQLATYLALLDISKGYHSFTWINQRFYFNPLTAHLEPICSDAYPGMDEHLNKLTLLSGMDTLLIGGLLKDSTFQKQYINALRHYSDTAYVHKVMRHYTPMLRRLESMLRTEWVNYHYNYNWLSYYSEGARINLSDLVPHAIARWDHGALEVVSFHPFAIRLEAYSAEGQRRDMGDISVPISPFAGWQRVRRIPMPVKPDSIIYRVPGLNIRFAIAVTPGILKDAPPAVDDRQQRSIVDDLSIRAYNQGSDSALTTLVVENYHHKPVELIGWGKVPGSIEFPFAQSYIIPAYGANGPGQIRVRVKESGSYLFYGEQGGKVIYPAEILPYPKPLPWSPASVFDNFPQKGAGYKVRGRTVIFNGHKKIQSLIAIPTGYRVYFRPGTHLVLEAGAGLLSHSPLRIQGTEHAPVIITANDTNTMGITVLDPGDSCVVTYTYLKGLNSLRTAGRWLTGALCFYHCPVIIDHLHSENNKSEDALNLVDTRFSVDHSSFEWCASDALDVDFGMGHISDTKIHRAFNDGFDISGATVDMDRCVIDDAGDKGISGGEQCTLTVRNVVISYCPMAIVAKDKSRVNVQGASINICAIALNAFTKKPEYGPAQIMAKDINTRQIKDLARNGPGSGVQVLK